MSRLNYYDFQSLKKILHNNQDTIDRIQKFTSFSKQDVVKLISTSKGHSKHQYAIC